MLKAVLAYHNRKIPKTHDLLVLSGMLPDDFALSEEELDLLDTATGYYTEGRYPHPSYTLPSSDEIGNVLSFSEKLFQRLEKYIARQ